MQELGFSEREKATKNRQLHLLPEQTNQQNPNPVPGMLNELLLKHRADPSLSTP